MIFNRKNFPVLELLKSGQTLISNKPLITTIPKLENQIMQNADTYNQMFEFIQKHFKINPDFNIEFVAEPVTRIFQEDEKVGDQLWELRDRVQDTVGVLLHGKGMQSFYVVYNNAEEKSVLFSVFQFFHECWTTLLLGEYRHDTFPALKISDLSFHPFGGISTDKPYYPGYPIQLIVRFLLFKEFAELEVKTVAKGKQRKAEINSQKYVTELDIPIRIVDSSWFTRIIRTEGFNVKGHFRLQPIGEGRTGRKLTWIEPFTKSGYTKKAKIEQNK